ncbi:MAG: citrate synthase [Erysipelotrichaceae bacterium]
MNKILKEFFQSSLEVNDIPNPLYTEYGVKKGLRNEDGTGVLVGLTKIADVVGYKRVDGKKVDDYGTLYYRGIDVKEIVGDSTRVAPHAFEETCFLILFGYLPTHDELDKFRGYLKSQYKLPMYFLEGNILRQPGKNLMNKLQQLVLMLYDYDEKAENTSIENTIQQGISILAKIPTIMCYAYQSKQNYYNSESLFIHHISEDYTIAQNILCLLRPDKNFTAKEAEVLDIMLVLHADHGGGNNSTFTNVVISSTGTDIYSSFAGAIGSMKGPRHGGANLRVKQMLNAVIQEIGYTTDEEKIRYVIERILNKEFFDQSGLIYGIGHAVYTKSDPRSVILQGKAYELAVEKERVKEYDFLKAFENMAIKIMYERKGINVSSNVDFYSGFVYDMLGIPEDLYTLLFVCARSVGWIAHNVENKLYCNRIVRPATKYVGKNISYTKMDKRER